MATVDQLKDGDIVSFSLIRSGIISDSFSSVIVDSIVSYDLAVRLDTSINEKHSNLYPFFKDKVNNINDPSNYRYLVVRANALTNKLMIVGIPWIQESSLKSTSTKDELLHLYNFEESKRPSLETFLKNANISYAFSAASSE